MGVQVSQRSCAKLIRLVASGLLTIQGAIAITVIGEFVLTKPNTVNSRAIAQEVKDTSATAATLQPGLEFERSPARNTVTIPVELVTRQHSTGTCSGSFFVPTVGSTVSTSTREGKVHAWFISNATPPASGLRVTIRNVSSKDANQTPYIDRKYDQGIRSERFNVGFGDRHSDRYLAVVEGTNNFTYEIKRGDTVVESGTFAVRIARETRTITETNAQLQPLDCQQRWLEQQEQLRQQQEQLQRELEQQQRLWRRNWQQIPIPNAPRLEN